MTDIVEQAARVIGAGRLILRDNGKRNNEKIAQALVDAGLLRDPARTVPTREEVETAIGGVLFNASNHPDPVTVLGKDVGPLRDKVTDAILALLADQPTVNETKAQALEEAAQFAEKHDPLADIWNGNQHQFVGAWFHTRARQIRDGK